MKTFVSGRVFGKNDRRNTGPINRGGAARELATRYCRRLELPNLMAILMNVELMILLCIARTNTVGCIDTIYQDSKQHSHV